MRRCRCACCSCRSSRGQFRFSAASPQMVRDLSEVHEPVGALGQSEPVALTPEQVASFHEHGYLAGVRILDDAQIERLREELARLMDPGHPGHDLFYEFHTNE